MYNINEYDETYIYSPSLHQDLYQKINKCFTNFLPFQKITNILNEEDIDVVIDELVNAEDFEKSPTGIEIYNSIEEQFFPQENDDGGKNILDGLNEKEMVDPRVQAKIKRSGHNNLSSFIINHDHYELPENYPCWWKYMSHISTK